MRLRLGSLFSGWGGLDMAIEAAFASIGVEVELAWVSDIEQFDKKGHQIGDAPAILAYRYPDVPNLGDITRVDWSAVPKVDAIGGGSPCQDVSTAGQLAGMTEGTRSNLWVEMREAIRVLKPVFVVWENVRGALSAKASTAILPAHIDRAIAHHQRVAQETNHAPTKARHTRAALRLMEHRARRVGVAYPKPALRAAGRVLGDLAELGFDAEWIGISASDIGGCHGRRREFILAAHPERVARLERWQPAPGQALRGGHSVQLHDVLEHLTPAHTAHNGPVRAGSAWDGRPGPTDCGHAAMSLLPTPTTRDSKGHNQRHDTTCLTGALLPTPSVADATGGHERRGGDRGGELLLKRVASHERFGKYAPAIARWEAILGHPAPSPTEPGKHGKPRLAAAFAEWMMGIEPGWVTGVPRLTRNQQLHAIGNGVVPHQGAAALRILLDRISRWDHA